MNILIKKTLHLELLFDAQSKASLVILLLRVPNSGATSLPGNTLGFHANEA